MKKLLVLLVPLALAVSVATPVASATAAPPFLKPMAHVVPPQSHAFGRSYGSWSAAWWQYVLAQPASTNPLTDPTGAGCGVAQSGPVFFLVGTTGGTATRDQCVVPQGKALFFPVANAFDVHTPGDGLNTPQAVWKDLQVTNALSFTSLYASIDGVPVKNLDNVATSPYRACAGPVPGCAPSFSLTLATGNILSIPAGTYAPTVADGYYLMLAPLRPGKHTISFGGTGNLGGPFSTATTYHLTVIDK
jgi:hypothetical protein